MKPLKRTPANNHVQRPLRILQFGGGNFLRAFIDWMIDLLNDETDFKGNIVLVKPTPAGDYGPLRRQDGLFHVLTRGVQNGTTVEEHRLITTVARIIHPYREWEEYLQTAEIPEMRFIFSNTTEAGIRFNPADRPGDHPPAEFPAKLTHWLYRRYTVFGGNTDKGCYILPCELLEKNGQKLLKAVLQYVDHWHWPDSFRHWITDANFFCNTLVDRIVPGFPEKDAPAVKAKLGYDDNRLVSAEPYHLFVVENVGNIRKELPLDQAGINVIFSKDITPHRTIKVRILNGAHTSMVPVGYLFGLDTVRETVENKVTGTFVQRVVRENIAPGLEFTPEILETYILDTIDRFRNPFIRHELLSISLNSTSKFETRILPSILAYQVKVGRWPGHLLFAWAAMICFYRGKRGEDMIPLKDDPVNIKTLDGLWKKVEEGTFSFAEMAEALVRHPSLFGPDLSSFPGLAETLAEKIGNIHRQGMKNALTEHLEKSNQ